MDNGSQFTMQPSDLARLACQAAQNRDLCDDPAIREYEEENTRAVLRACAEMLIASGQLINRLKTIAGVAVVGGTVERCPKCAMWIRPDARLGDCVRCIGTGFVPTLPVREMPGFTDAESRAFADAEAAYLRAPE